MGQRFGLSIRAAVAADAPGIAELLGGCGLTIASSDIEARLGRIRQGGGAVLLADEWGPPSGIVCATWAPSLVADLPVATLDLLAVAPDSRRRGIARLLLKSCAQAARAAGCGTIRGEAGEASLRGFYAASGFEAAGPLVMRPLRKGG